MNAILRLVAKWAYGQTEAVGGLFGSNLTNWIF
jgi:hypothetical protein